MCKFNYLFSVLFSIISFQTLAMESKEPEPAHLHKEVARCQKCGILDANLMCGACGKVKYCSKECQVPDWAAHKQFCYLERLRVEVEAQKFLKIINPHYRTSRAFAENCTNATMVYEYALTFGKMPKGYEGGAIPYHEAGAESFKKNNVLLAELLGLDQRVFRIKSIEHVDEELRKLGDGARFAIQAMKMVKGLAPAAQGGRRLGVGMQEHTWSAFMIDGQIYHFNAQKGRPMEKRELSKFRDFKYRVTYSPQ